MSKSVGHRQRYGRTKEWRGTGVYVSRQAVLNDELDTFKAVQANAIILVFGDGYTDAEERVLRPENARELRDALDAALAAVTATEKASEALNEGDEA